MVTSFTCPDCNGSGMEYYDQRCTGDKCYTCKGTGEVDEEVIKKKINNIMDDAKKQILDIIVVKDGNDPQN